METIKQAFYRVLAAGLVLSVAPLASAAEDVSRQLICRMRVGRAAPIVALRYGLRLVDRTEEGAFALFEAPPWMNIHLAQIRLNRDRSVVWAEDNVEMSATDPIGGKGSVVPIVSYPPAGLRTLGAHQTSVQENTQVLNQIGWNESLAYGPGRTVKVAILDTGLSPYHADLWQKVDASYNAVERTLPAYDIPRGQETNGNGTPDDAVGHGTMVTSVVDTVAPKVRLLVVRVSDSDGRGTAWSLVKGLAFAVRNGAEVANVSLGSPSRLPSISDVMDWCEQNNLLVVAPIGNSGQEMAMHPSRISSVVCVAGVEADNRKSPFSNWDGKCDVSAPASGIRGRWWEGDEFTIWSGTSFATPMVSAAVADCLRRRSGRVSPGVLQEALEDSGTRIDAINPRYEDEIGTLLNINALNSELSRIVP